MTADEVQLWYTQHSYSLDPTMGDVVVEDSTGLMKPEADGVFPFNPVSEKITNHCSMSHIVWVQGGDGTARELGSSIPGGVKNGPAVALQALRHWVRMREGLGELLCELRPERPPWSSASQAGVWFSSPLREVTFPASAGDFYRGFHGTSLHCVWRIVRRGFDRGFNYLDTDGGCDAFTYIHVEKRAGLCSNYMAYSMLVPGWLFGCVIEVAVPNDDPRGRRTVARRKNAKTHQNLAYHDSSVIVAVWWHLIWVGEIEHLPRSTWITLEQGFDASYEINAAQEWEAIVRHSAEVRHTFAVA